MLAGIHDITAEQNSQYEITFKFYDATNEVVAVTDVVHFVVRRSSLPQDKNLFEILSNGAATEGLISFPDTDEIYGTVTVANETIDLTITTKTMNLVPPGSYFYYLNFVDGEIIKSILKGKFVVEAP